MYALGCPLFQCAGLVFGLTQEQFCVAFNWPA